jgi:hypothetical protein
MAQSFNVKKFFSTNKATVATSSTSFLNTLAIENSESEIKLKTTSISQMDDSDLDTDQIRRRPSDLNRSNYASTDDILHESTASTAQLTNNDDTSPSISFFINDFFKSKAKIITIGVLFTLNLVNYMDRFTVAGNWKFCHYLFIFSEFFFLFFSFYLERDFSIDRRKLSFRRNWPK